MTPALGAQKFLDAVLRRLELYGVQLFSERAVSIAAEGEGWVIYLESGEALSTTALVADLGESAIANTVLLPHVQSVLPREARAYASTVMERPEWLPRGSRAIARVNDWAVEIDASFDTEMLNPRNSSTNSAWAGEPEALCTYRLVFKAAEAAELSEALDELQSQDLPNPLRLNLGTGTGDEWLRGALLQETAVRAAPYRTIAARNAASTALAELEAATPNLSVVGRAVHGDDQGAALSAAHASAVQMRRRLLGLTA